MRLTAAAILAADDLKREEVDCPEWGGTVEVRGLTLAERGRFVALTSTGGEAVLAAELVAMAAIDAAGERLFTSADVAALSAKNGGPIERLAKAILRLSGMAGEEGEPEKN